jgi:hypothetical protein
VTESSAQQPLNAEHADSAKIAIGEKSPIFAPQNIAVAYLLYQIARRPAAKEFVKAIMLAVAFLYWAANQLWPGSPQATLFNDMAIALFVLDVFLVMTGWPKTSPDESFAETYVQKPEM